LAVIFLAPGGSSNAERGRQAVLANVEPADAVLALKRDEHGALLRRAADRRQPFRVAVALARQHLAGLRPDGAEAHAFEADGTIAVVGDLAAHPAPDVGDGEELLALGVHDEPRPAAEVGTAMSTRGRRAI
jgi:hypothetical protein